MNRFIFLAIFILLTLTAISCIRKSPQLPSNKVVEIDSSAISLQLANEKLIAGEDSLIENFVAKTGIDFKKSASGLWYKVYKLSNGENKPMNGQNYTIEYTVNSFDNALLFNEQKSFVAGKKHIVNGIEEVFLLLNKGDSAVAVMPWYIGYGIKGNQDIPAYTSVVVHVKRIK